MNPLALAPIIALTLVAGAARPGSARAAEPAGRSDGEGQLPGYARDVAQWKGLLETLVSRQAYFGAMAVAARLPVLFQEVAAKELAYRTIIRISDLGYPAPVKALFFAADLEPGGGADPGFAQNYYFYKGLINREKGFENWSQYHFGRVDPERSERFQYYQALQAYGAKDLRKAREKLTGILERRDPERSLAFTKKLARLLARIYFEEKHYGKALELYREFLLKLPVVSPSDWLEAAWCLFYLKRYPEALGHLYNLESEIVGGAVYLEKYILRGLIYHALCDRDRTVGLIAEYERKFWPSISAIKNGELLRKDRVLLSVRSGRAGAFQDLLIVEAGLKHELSKVAELAGERRALAEYVYRTETAALRARMASAKDTALNRMAQELVLAHESLRFLGFEIAKAKLDPDKVFASKGKREPAQLVKSAEDRSFELRWDQPGDFWRDERLSYVAEVRSQCGD